MAKPQTLRQIGLLSLLACAASGYGLYIDRQTPIALDLVEAHGRSVAPQVVMSNSFGFGGQNAALVVARAGWEP